MSQPTFKIWKEFVFDAAHQLESDTETNTNYRRLHGHSYQAQVWLCGPQNIFGWVADIGELERRLLQIKAKLDHHFLNEVEGLGIPTMENLAIYIWDSLSDVKQLQRVVIQRRQSGEGCEYFGPTLEQAQEYD